MTSHDYWIREIFPYELEKSAAVIRSAFATVAEEFGFTPENNPTNGAFLQPLKLEEERLRGVRQFGLFLPDGMQAGFVALEEAANGIWYLEKLAVCPTFRHCGYGRALVDFARGFAGRAGGERVSIAIINENTCLKDWYVRYGFTETGQKHFDHLPFTVCFLEIGAEC